MLGRVVKLPRAIELCSAFRDISRNQQGKAHKAVPNHQRGCCPLLSSERQELGRKLAHHVAVKRHVIRHPEAVEHGEQQQWVFRRLSKRFSLFDQQTCPLHGCLGFLGGIAFDREEWGYERDLKLDLFATQRGRGGQGRNLVERKRDLLYGFNQCRALRRPLSRFAPQPSGFLDLPGLGAQCPANSSGWFSVISAN
jgi:hypothetical protein